MGYAPTQTVVSHPAGGHMGPPLPKRSSAIRRVDTWVRPYPKWTGYAAGGHVGPPLPDIARLCGWAASAEGAAWEGAGVFGAVDYYLAVDYDVLDADRVLLGVFAGGGGLDRGRGRRGLCRP